MLDVRLVSWTDFLTLTERDHETYLPQPAVLAMFSYPYGTIQSARILFLSSILGESELKYWIVFALSYKICM